MNVTLWSGVAVAMQSVLGAALAVSAVAKANPGVATSTAHGLSNGDFVLLQNVQGMLQINNRIFRVTSVSANSFTLDGDGADTTLYDTFISGNAYKITFGTNFSTLLDISVTGGEFATTDTTTIHDRQRTLKNTIASAIEMSSNSVWDVADPGLIAAKKASDVSADRCLMFTFQNGQKFLINAGVGCSLSPVGQAQDKVTTSLKFTGRGPSTTLPN